MNMTLGEKIRKARKRKMTQAELAEAIGVHEMTIRRWELGKNFPDVGALQKIADALSIPLSEFTDDNAPSQVSQLEQLIQKLNEIQPSLPPKDTNKEEKIKDPLVGTEYPFKKPQEYLDLGYWGNVAENAKLAAQFGTEQEKAAVLTMLRMAENAITGDNKKGQPPSVSAYNGNNSSYSGNTLEYNSNKS